MPGVVFSWLAELYVRYCVVGSYVSRISVGCLHCLWVSLSILNTAVDIAMPKRWNTVGEINDDDVARLGGFVSFHESSGGAKKGNYTKTGPKESHTDCFSC